MLHFHSTERYCCVAIKNWPKPCHLLQLVMFFWFMPTRSTAVTQQNHWSKNSELKDLSPRKHLFSPVGHYAMCLVGYLSSLPCTRTRAGLSLGRWNLWVTSTPSSEPAARLRLGAFLLGCLFYVSSDCLFRLFKKKNLCWYISPSNKPKNRIGVDSNVCTSPRDKDRSSVNCFYVCFGSPPPLLFLKWV